jgi:hypothetical protein
MIHFSKSPKPIKTTTQVVKVGCYSASYQLVGLQPHHQVLRVLFVSIIYKISEATHKAGIDCHHNNVYEYGTHIDIFKTGNIEYYQTVINI